MAHSRDYRDPYRAHYGDGPYVCAYCGKPLLTLEVVHHVDEDRTNNAIGNLQAMHTDCHNKLHHIGLKHTDEIRRQIAESLNRAYADGRHARPDVAGERNPFFGKTHSAETRAKISAARRKK